MSEKKIASLPHVTIRDLYGLYPDFFIDVSQEQQLLREHEVIVFHHPITTGGKKEAFSAKGYNKYPLEEILQPFELTAALCQMHWLEPLVLYWARNISDVERYQHAEQYRQWLFNPLGGEHGADQ